MKKFLVSAALLCAALSVWAVTPHRFIVPDIPGYITLKGDFHNHTAFSDGAVWPTDRISEAVIDDLDVISITDHCDTRHRKMVREGYFNADKCTRNASYEIAAPAAKKAGIIAIHGAEITRGKRLFPGHFNAHFIQDGEALANEMEKEDSKIKDVVKRDEAAIMNGLKEARRQGAFLVWNHPNWEAQAANEVTWWPIHEKVFKAGLMDAIEIVNHAVAYSPEAFHMAIEHNLAVVSGTDCHSAMTSYVDYELNEHRAMTLLFVKERSEAGVREALDAHRTAVCHENFVYGREEQIRPLLDAILQISEVKVSGKKVSCKVVNVSSIPVHLLKAPGSEILEMKRLFTINPGEQLNLKFVPRLGKEHFEADDFDINYYITNFQTDADTPLLVSHHISVPAKYRK